MKTYVMRHGDVNYEEKIIKEWLFLSLPLNEKGILRVKQTAERIKEISPRAIFHSPILRCIQTANILFKQKVKTGLVISVPELRAIKFPKDPEELKKMFSDHLKSAPDWREAWFEKKIEYDMESPLNFLHRTRKAFSFMERICQNYCLAEPILVVAHAETICACRHLFGLASFREEIKKMPDFCEIAEFEI